MRMSKEEVVAWHKRYFYRGALKVSWKWEEWDFSRLQAELKSRDYSSGFLSQNLLPHACMLIAGYKMNACCLFPDVHTFIILYKKTSRETFRVNIYG